MYIFAYDSEDWKSYTHSMYAWVYDSGKAIFINHGILPKRKPFAKSQSYRSFETEQRSGLLIFQLTN